MTVSDGIKGICQYVNAHKNQFKINYFVKAKFRCPPASKAEMSFDYKGWKPSSKPYTWPLKTVCQEETCTRLVLLLPYIYGFSLVMGITK